jgi:hypothetical protein
LNVVGKLDQLFFTDATMVKGVGLRIILHLLATVLLQHLVRDRLVMRECFVLVWLALCLYFLDALGLVELVRWVTDA